jgi:hypothetical protein
MPFDSIKELNEEYDIYLPSIINDTDPPPPYIIQYIIEYLNLPYSELKKYGFTIGFGAPDKGYKNRDSNYTTRLTEKLDKAIRFYARHDLSVYHELCSRLLESHIIDTLPVHELYLLRRSIYNIYEKFNKLTDPYADKLTIVEIDEAYTELFMKIDRMILNKPDMRYDYILDNNELDRALKKIVNHTSSKFDELHAAINSNPSYLEHDANGKQLATIEYYIAHLGTKKYILYYLDNYVRRIILHRSTMIEQNMIAMTFSILIKEMLFHIESADVEERPFWIRESIRTFKPWLTRPSRDDPSTYMVYPLMDKNKIMQYKRKQINRVDWERWMRTITSTIIPVSETEEWMQILDYGRELYGDDPIVAMQEEYNKLSRKKEDHLVKGRTPLEVHGTTTSKNGTRVPVIIYGEKHDQIDNAFYKNHSFDQRKDMAIWVEHNPLTCNIISNANEKAKYRDKGSEWIWYQRIIHDLPVTCVDIRTPDIDSLLIDDAIRYIVDLPVYFTTPDKIKIRDEIIIKHTLDNISMLLAFLEKRIKQYEKIMSTTHHLTAIYMKYRRMIRKQLQEIHSIIERNLDPNESLFYELLQHLVSNMFMLHSILVDGHIITLLQTYKDSKPIAIFVGMIHALRIAYFFEMIEMNSDPSWDNYQNWKWLIKPNNTVDINDSIMISISSLTPTNIDKPKKIMNKSLHITHKSHKYNNSHKKSHKSYKQKKSYQPPRNYTRKQY